jgi:hypothetical protein
MKTKKLRLIPVTCILVMLLTIGMSFSPVKAADDCGYMNLELRTNQILADPPGNTPDAGFIDDLFLRFTFEFGLYKAQGYLYAGDGWQARSAPFGSARLWYDSDTGNRMLTISLTGTEDFNPGIPDSRFFRPSQGQITVNLETQEGTFWSTANGFFEAEWGQSFVRLYSTGDVLVTRGYSKCFSLESRPCNSRLVPTERQYVDFEDGCATISGAAFDGTDLWVAQRGAICGGADDYIHRIDGDGNTLETIPSPCVEGRTWGLAFEIPINKKLGSPVYPPLWVACDDSMLYKIDQTDGSIILSKDHSANVGGARGLAFDGEWLVLASQEAEDGPGKLSNIHPSTGDVASQILAPGNHPAGLAFERYGNEKDRLQYLWLADLESNKLYRLDRYATTPEGYRIVCTYFLPEDGPAGLGWGLGPFDQRRGVLVSDWGAGIYGMYPP